MCLDTVYAHLYHVCVQPLLHITSDDAHAQDPDLAILDANTLPDGPAPDSAAAGAGDAPVVSGGQPGSFKLQG